MRFLCSWDYHYCQLSGHGCVGVAASKTLQPTKEDYLARKHDLRGAGRQKNQKSRNFHRSKSGATKKLSPAFFRYQEVMRGSRCVIGGGVTGEIGAAVSNQSVPSAVTRGS